MMRNGQVDAMVRIARSVRFIQEFGLSAIRFIQIPQADLPDPALSERARPLVTIPAGTMKARPIRRRQHLLMWQACL